jgi:hypothetical protein
MTRPDDTVPAAMTAPVATSWVRPWALALTAGLAAGIGAWAIAEPMLIPDPGRLNVKGEVVVSPAEKGMHNGVLSFGALGAALGLGLGLGGGLIQPSLRRASLAAVIGLSLGAGAGALTSWLIVPVYYKHVSEDDVTYSLLVHGAVWGAVGAAAGLAFAIGQGGWGRLPRAILGCVGAALVATAVYEFAGAILLPRALTNKPVSATSESRLAGRLLVAVMVAAGAVMSTASGVESTEKP